MKTLLTFVLLSIVSLRLSAEIVTGTDDLAHLPYWELHKESVSFRLVQRLPDQTRAYFSGRGFSKEDAEYIASYCFFQTIFTNTATEKSQDLIEYDANKWQVMVKGHKSSLVLREQWSSIWDQRKAGAPQRIAFNWSLLPTRQQYQPSDYNWGMTVFKLPHGTSFDLKLFWFLNGIEKNTIIKNLQCAKDIYLPPPEM